MKVVKSGILDNILTQVSTSIRNGNIFEGVAKRWNFQGEWLYFRGGFWRIKKSDWRERSSYGENPLMGV